LPPAEQLTIAQVLPQPQVAVQVPPEVPPLHPTAARWKQNQKAPDCPIFSGKPGSARRWDPLFSEWAGTRLSPVDGFGGRCR
jgi:hypothetical protein